MSPLRAVESSDQVAAQGEPGVTPPRHARDGRPRFLTDVVVELGLAEVARVEQAVALARTQGTTPEAVLIEQGALDQSQLSRAIAERHGLDHLDLAAFPVDFAAANLLDPAAARRHEAVPVGFRGERGLIVALTDPANVNAVDDISLATGYEVRIAVASREDVLGLIQRLSHLDSVVAEVGDVPEAVDEIAEVVDLHESADEAPIIRLVNQVLARAIEQGASDVHFEPFPESGGAPGAGVQLRVRFRIDGVLSETTAVPRRMVAGVISRIKIMADLDIAEKRMPQDGRVGLTLEGRHVDLRVVTLPSVHGEGAVIRILDQGNIVMDLDRLGFAEQEASRFRRGFSQAFGAILVTGPTGSGKSTSLYAALGELNTPEKNIITIEDPVEYQLDGVTQVQVNARAGLSFATGLRSLMRADPDIIMVGEIRDREAAQIAVESALTGHLVLSTLHTNDAPSAITRLVEMGIEPFLVSSAITCVVAQRLARTLCAHCKQRTILPAELLQANGFPARTDLEAYEPAGCPRCGGTGYRGRLGLYEVMAMTDELRRMTVARAPADEIAEVAVRSGMRRLREDGLEKVRQGRTSLTEVARVTGTGAATFDG